MYFGHLKQLTRGLEENDSSRAKGDGAPYWPDKARCGEANLAVTTHHPLRQMHSLDRQGWALENEGVSGNTAGRGPLQGPPITEEF